MPTDGQLHHCAYPPCGKPFTRTRRDKLTCSTVCRTKEWRRLNPYTYLESRRATARRVRRRKRAFLLKRN